MTTQKPNLMQNEIIILTTSIKQYCIFLLGMIWAFLLPVAPLLIVCGIAIFADTVMGLIRAKKLKEKITSRKLSQVISKMLLYQTTILFFFFLESILLHEFIALFSGIDLLLTKIVTTVLISVELLSFNESFTVISGFSMWSKFKQIIRRTGDAKKMVEDNLGDVLTRNKKEDNDEPNQANEEPLIK
jgi:hypothetical protein